MSSYSFVLSACRFRTYVSTKGHREFCIFYTPLVWFTRVIWIFQYPVILGVWGVYKGVERCFQIYFCCKLFLAWGVFLVMDAKVAFICLIWTSVVSIQEQPLQSQVLQTFICIGKLGTDLAVLSGVTHISMSFGRNRAEVFNYNTLYPLKELLKYAFPGWDIIEIQIVTIHWVHTTCYKNFSQTSWRKTRCVQNAVKQSSAYCTRSGISVTSNMMQSIKKCFNIHRN